jgi:FAD:protein FMN transferase
MHVQFPAVVLLLALAGCEKSVGEPRYTSVEGAVMGTYYVFTARCIDADAAFNSAAKALADVDAELSTYKPDSQLMRLNQTPVGTPLQASMGLWSVLSLAKVVREQSGGAFDVSVGALVNAWGFGPAKTRAAPEVEEIQRLLPPMDGGFEFLEPDQVTRTRDDVFIDLSAIAKGYGVDVAVETLRRTGCTDAMVDVGGEVRAYGVNKENQPWRIGIEIPSELQTGVEAVVMLQDRAVATSGDYRNYREVDGRRISHTIDPRDGYPIRHTLASVSVVRNTAAEADAWATALNVLGPDAGLALAEQEAIPVYMLVRQAKGFDERYTSTMKNLLESQ